MSDRLSSDLASLRIDRDASQPRGGRMRVLVIVGAVAVAVAVAAYFLIPYVKNKVFKTEIAVTEISVVSPAQAQVLFTSTGYVEPETYSQVAAKVAGRVMEVKVKNGDRLKKGQVLLELDRVNQLSAVRTTRARVAAAQASSQTARAQVLEAENQAKLARRMAEQGVGAQATAIDAEARVNSLRAAVKAAEAQVRASSRRSPRCESTWQVHRARADRRHGDQQAARGGRAGRPRSAASASQLGSIELADFASLLVETDVPEARLHLVKIGTPCEIVLDAFPTGATAARSIEIARASTAPRRPSR